MHASTEEHPGFQSNFSFHNQHFAQLTYLFWNVTFIILTNTEITNWQREGLFDITVRDEEVDACFYAPAVRDRWQGEEGVAQQTVNLTLGSKKETGTTLCNNV